MQKPGRNDCCWCGSGKKYKYCHLPLENRCPVSLLELVRDHRALRSMGHCYHPCAGPQDCDGPIGAAHTIPRSALKAIAETGHVYEWLSRRDFGGFMSGSWTPRPKRVGIKRASVLRIFCQGHDSELFQPIEQGPWKISAETASLWAFRALAYELHAKEVSATWPNVLRKTQWGRSFEDQVRIEDFARRFGQETRVARQSLRTLKSEWDRVLIGRNYSGVRFYAVLLDRAPDFLLSSFFWPSVDFSANWICKTTSHLEWTSVSVLPYDAGGIVLLAWLDQPRRHCATFADSLDALANDELPHAITRMAFEFFENVFIRPCWWDGLNIQVQESLMNRGLQLPPYKRACLTDDGVTAVEWQVVKRLRSF